MGWFDDENQKKKQKEQGAADKAKPTKYDYSPEQKEKYKKLQEGLKGPSWFEGLKKKFSK